LFNTQRDLKKARYDFLVNGLKLKAAAGSLADQDVEIVNALLVR
jgi:outer membrane protein